MENEKKFYRYEDHYIQKEKIKEDLYIVGNQYDPVIILREFTQIKETPKGCWIKENTESEAQKEYRFEINTYGKPRFCVERCY
jgi:hypothetical protein